MATFYFKCTVGDVIVRRGIVYNANPHDLGTAQEAACQSIHRHFGPGAEVGTCVEIVDEESCGEIQASIDAEEHQRYIVVTVDPRAPIYGQYGIGDTLEEALARACRKKRQYKWPRAEYVFTSNLPFVPLKLERVPEENECDAAVTTDGAVVWQRCERRTL